MNEVWFVFTTMGEMKLREILVECQNQGWVPILIARQENKVTVPCFLTQKIAIDFAKRNLPKNHLFGTTILTDADIEKINSSWVKERGWNLETFNHPKLMKNNSKIDVEVFEFQEKPDVYGVWGKQCENSKIISLS